MGSRRKRIIIVRLRYPVDFGELQPNNRPFKEQHFTWKRALDRLERDKTWTTFGWTSVSATLSASQCWTMTEPSIRPVLQISLTVSLATARKYDGIELRRESTLYYYQPTCTQERDKLELDKTWKGFDLMIVPSKPSWHRYATKKEPSIRPVLCEESAILRC